MVTAIAPLPSGDDVDDSEEQTENEVICSSNHRGRCFSGTRSETYDRGLFRTPQ